MSLSRRRLLSLLPLAALAGCGFKLRGSNSLQMPYRTLHVALPENSEVRIWLERYIRASGSTELVDEPNEAEAIFQQVRDSRFKTVLSVNAQGRVREYRLQLDYAFRLINPKGQELVRQSDISLTRDISFDDSNVLAKDLEEGLLWRDMNNDLVNQIVRRLTIVKPRDPNQDDDE